MSFKQFDTAKIDEAKQQYAAEAKRRWGNTAAYAEYEKKSADYNTVQQEQERKQEAANAENQTVGSGGAGNRADTQPQTQG